MPKMPGIYQAKDDLQDMYVQGAFPMAGIMPVNLISAASPADQSLLAGFDPIINTVSTPNAGVNATEERLQGATPLQIPDALAAQVTYLLTNIKPVQDLHGYANPWPAGGGKNLLTIDSVFHDDNTGDVTIFNGSITGTFTLSADISEVTSSTSPNAALCLIVVDGVNQYGLSLSNLSYTCTGTITSIIVFSANSYTKYRGTVKFQLEAGTTATAWTPYENICPVSGWTGCNVYISPTTNPGDATVYPCTWQDEAGTVYGGTIDVASGVMEVTHKSYDITGVENWQKATTQSTHWRFSLQFTAIAHSNTADTISSHYKARTPTETYTGNMGVSQNTNNSTLFICDERFSNSTDFKTFLADEYSAGTPVQVVYPLLVHEYYQVPAVNIQTLNGDQYGWTDCGDYMDIVYSKQP